MPKMADLAPLLDKPGGTSIGKTAKQGLPIEILETTEIGEPKIKWLKIKVIDPAGIKEGWVLATKVDTEGEEDSSIERADFAEECLMQALFVGINAHFLIAVAQLRSQIKAGKDGDKVGPFRLTASQWNAARTDTEFKLDYPEDQIGDWRRQCGAFAVMAYRAQEKFSNDSIAQSTADPKVGKLPSAVELYRAIWPQDAAQLPGDMQKALDATAKDIQDAIPKVTTVKIADPVLENADDTASPTNPKPGTATAPDTASGSGIGKFEVLAPRIMKDLMPAFGLTADQAAAILGNLGHECAGFRLMQEVKPLAGKGGLGWAQWTGPRRRTFVAFCNAKNFPTDSFAGNMEYLKSELDPTHGSERGAIPAIKKPGASIPDMVKAFELKFERAHPNFKHYESRNKFADKALAAFNAG